MSKVFAKGLSKEKIFFIFVIFSIFGTYYEQILNLITHYLADGSIFWEYRRGVIFGPFSPIYGAGAVLFLVLLKRKELSNFKTFLYGSLLGGFFEYIISLLQEIFVGTKSWDYSKHFLNIGGRTTIPFMIFWGLLALALVKVIYPFLSNLIEKIPYNIGIILYYVLLIFMIFDLLFSFSALIRQNLRRNNIKPFSFIGEFYDKHYPDDVLHKYYPNMVTK